MTNEEKIKSISANELANKLYEIVPCDMCPIFEFCKPSKTNVRNCVKNWKRWLKSEVD